MRPYSMDLRERVAAAIDAGEGSQRQVAKRFRVSVSFVTRLVQRRRDAGTLAPKPHGGGPRPALGFPERVRLAVRIAEHPDAGTVKIVGFRGKLGLSKRRNLLRYSPTWKDPYFTDGAAHGRSLGGKAERNHLVSQPLAGTRAGVREEPRSLEVEVQDVARAAQGFPHRSAGPASFARSVASQGRGPGTGNQPTACPVAAASRAVPPAPSRRLQPVLTQLSS